MRTTTRLPPLRPASALSGSVLLLILTFSSCDIHPDAPESGGGPLWNSQSAWRLSADPTLDLAEFAGSPTHEFTRIQTVLFLDDGRIVAANSFNPPEVRAFHPSGELDWMAGGNGEGPGEFTLITRIFRGGPDTLVVTDSRQNRATLLTHAGEVLDVVTVETESTGERPVQRVVLGRFTDGTFLGFPNLYFPAGARDYGIASVLLLQLQLDGSIVDTVGLFPWTDFQPGEGGTRTSPIFGLKAAAIPHEDRILHGLGDQYSVHTYDLRGVEQGSFHRPFTPRAVTPEMLSALEQEELAQVRGPESDLWRAQIARRYRDGPRTEHLPAFERFLLDSDEHLWVQNFVAPPDTAITWSVFHPSGSFLGELVVPTSFRIDDVTGGFVLGVWNDELDVETVRSYRLVKPGVS